MHAAQVIEQLLESLHMHFDTGITRARRSVVVGFISFQGSFPSCAIGQLRNGRHHPHTLKHETREDVVVYLPNGSIYHGAAAT
jgi:hypothetical protein